MVTSRDCVRFASDAELDLQSALATGGVEVELFIREYCLTPAVHGLAMTLFGRVPRAGETIEHEGYTIEVLEATPKRVGRVQFTRSAVEVES